MKVYLIKKKSYTGGAAYNSYLEENLKNNFEFQLLELKGRNLNKHTLLSYYISRIFYRIYFLIKLFFINLNKEIKIRDFKYTGYMILSPIRGKNIKTRKNRIL